MKSTVERAGWLPHLSVIVAVVAGVGALTWTGARSGSPVADAAARGIGAPWLRARPVVADVTGDGVEDVILVTAIDGGRAGDGTAGKAGAPHEVFVQAIDGNDGRVLYALPQGAAHAAGRSIGDRIVLLVSKDRLGVAHVPEEGDANISIHERATGKQLKKLSFARSTGHACENRGGPGSPKGTFFFERPASSTGTVIDLEHMSVAVSSSSSCADVATANVADLASLSTDDAASPPRFSHETTLRKGAGPYGGRTLVSHSGLGYLAVDRSTSRPVPSDDDAGPTRGIELVGLDILAGKTLFERSLVSLGLTAGVLERIEATERGPLLFFANGLRLALLDAQRGDVTWTLPLSIDDRVSSYTLTPSRLYLHVQASGEGRSSSNAGSRILVIDLASGRILRSLP